MKSSRGTNTQLSMSNQTKLTILLVLIGAGLILLITLLALLLGGRLPFQAAQPQSPTILPTLFIPTEDCSPPTLTLGVTPFEIEATSLTTDGSASVPPDTNGIAYQVDGTSQGPVFILSPTAENLALLTSLPEGISATVTASNCDSTTFTLSAPQPGDFKTASQPGQAPAGLLIFLQLDPTGEGFMVRGEMTGEEIHTFNTPAVDGTEVQAEIGLVETKLSVDGGSLQVTVSIYNFGSAAFTVTPEDISLTAADGAALSLSASEPSLPKEVGPSVTESFIFTFPRPSTPTSTLKVFTVEYDVEGY